MYSLLINPIIHLFFLNIKDFIWDVKNIFSLNGNPHHSFPHPYPISHGYAFTVATFVISLRRILRNFFTFQGSGVTKKWSPLDWAAKKFLGVIEVGESEKRKKNRNFGLSWWDMTENVHYGLIWWEFFRLPPNHIFFSLRIFKNKCLIIIDLLEFFRKRTKCGKWSISFSANRNFLVFLKLKKIFRLKEKF